MPKEGFGKLQLLLTTPFARRAVVVLLVAAVGLWLVLAKSASNYYLAKQPGLALSFDQSNNFALSKIARLSLLGSTQELQFERASELALDAIRFAPRDSESLAVLGFAADAGKFEADGHTLIERAESYSKRTLLAQLYLIDHYAKQGDVQRALEHYDLALSTHPASQPQLLPRLFMTLGAPQVREQLIELLRNDPTWKRDFWMDLTNLRPVPPELVGFLEEVGGDERVLIPGVGSRLVQALISERRYEEGRRVAVLLGREERVVQGARPLDDFLYEEPLRGIDWRYESTGSHTAIPAEAGLLLSTRGSKNVAFANRVAKLPEGRTFSISGTVESDIGMGEVTVSIRCAGQRDPLAIGRATFNDGGKAAISMGPFVIPTAACSWQWLQIAGKGASTRSSQFLLQELELTEGGA